MTDDANAVSYDPAKTLTVTDLMRRWRCTRKVILDAIKAGRLAAFRVGKRAFRMTLDEVIRYEHTRARAA